MFIWYETDFFRNIKYLNYLPTRKDSLCKIQKHYF